MITLNNVSLRRGAKLLLDKATVTLNPGEKVGLVGRNGAGKSTLFALLNGTLHEDGGDFSIPKVWRMAQVAQNMPETEESATEFVIAGDTRLIELREALEVAEKAEDGMAMAHAHVDLADAGEHDATSRAQALILGLGFKVSELDQAVNSFSGGWRMRLQLARALMCPSDLLLLDEPTNHLDIETKEILIQALEDYNGTIMAVSHDRYFLDFIVNKLLVVKREKSLLLDGNYSENKEQVILELSKREEEIKIDKNQIIVEEKNIKIRRIKSNYSNSKGI
jgi:ATP-binding cassette subfamily F protein 3